MVETFPLNTRRKLNLRKMLKKFPETFLNVLSTFKICFLSSGCFFVFLIIIVYLAGISVFTNFILLSLLLTGTTIGSYKKKKNKRMCILAATKR